MGLKLFFFFLSAVDTTIDTTDTTSTSKSSTNEIVVSDPTDTATPSTRDTVSSGNTVLITAIAVICVIAVVIIVLLLYRRKPGYRVTYLRSQKKSKYEKKWEIKRSQLKIGNKVGEGFFGSVLKAETVGNVKGWTDTTVAVKAIHGQCNDVIQVQTLLIQELIVFRKTLF